MKKIINILENHPGKVLMAFFGMLIAANIAFFSVSFCVDSDYIPPAEREHAP